MRPMLQQKFDPESMFGIALDSHLPFDQESHANDTNYVRASVERIAKDVRVWGRCFRGFAPRFVYLGADRGIESVTAIRGDDLETRRLPALFKAIDGYFAGFSGISPAEGRSSETNRTWEGVSPDGIGYSVNVFTSIRNSDGTAQIRLTLHSESDRCGAELRKAKLEKEDKSRIAAAYRMMQDKAYQGYWRGCDGQVAGEVHPGDKRIQCPPLLSRGQGVPSGNGLLARRRRGTAESAEGCDGRVHAKARLAEGHGAQGL